MADTPTKIEDGQAYPKSDFAHTPDDIPSHWKLRLTSTPGGPPDPRIVGMAVAALGKGSRGNKVEIPTEDIPAVISRVRSAWKKANPDKAEGDMPEVLQAAEPGMGDVHVPTIPEKKRGPGETFLSRLYAALKEHMASGEPLTADTFSALFRSARGAAGGTVSRPKPKVDEDLLASAAEPPAVCPECGGDIKDGVCVECGGKAETYTAGEILLAFAEYSGCIVALVPSSDVSSSLAIDGGLPPEDIHLTICHLGDTVALGPIGTAEAIVAVRNAARNIPPLVGEISGAGRFTNGDQEVVYASFDSPELEKLRGAIHASLQIAGIPISTDHGFTPHMTLAYGKAEVPTIEPRTIRFDNLSAWMGEQHVDVPLTGGVIPAAYSDEGVMPWEGDEPLSADLPTKSSGMVVIVGGRQFIVPVTDDVSAPLDLADIAAHGHTHRLFNASSFIEAPEWIPCLPKPGTYKHPSYGDIKITPERNARFVANIKNNVYQHRLPIDAEHQTKLSGACGWIIDAKQNSDGSVDGKVEWTERGRVLLKDNRFAYISPEWYDKWEDPATHQSHHDVLIGAALTSRPFYKNSALRPLVASEYEIQVTKGADMADEQNTEQFTELQRQLTEQQQALKAREDEIAALKQANEAETAALKQMAEAQAEQLKQMAENHKKLERDRRTDRFEQMVKSEKWFGEYAKSLTILSNLADTFGEDHETFTAYVAQQRATAELARNSNLFLEIGTDAGGTPPSGEAQIEALTRKRMTETKEDYATAYTATLDANPQLYTEYTKGA